MNTDLTPLEVAQQVSAGLSSLKNNSLPEYTKATRLAPIVLIDKRVMSIDQKQMTVLLQTLLSVYAGHYLTAVNLTMSVGNVKVMRIMDQFSTDRSLLNATGNSAWWANESINDTLCYLPNPSMEADTSYLQPLAGHNKEVDNDKSIHNITDESNLVVGKLLDVKLVSGENKITIPVNITLTPKSIEAEDFLAISKANSTDRSMGARYHQWRSGEIRFIKDYLLTLDLIEEDKKALLADKTGSMLANRSKRYKGIMATLISGYASPNAVSTMIIISKQTASDLEILLMGKLKNSHVRDKYFSSNSTMSLVVVDTRMERFTLYQRGIVEYGEYTFEDIKLNNKKSNGTDIEAIVKAYTVGNAASL